jgi:hypothetical protein
MMNLGLFLAHEKVCAVFTSVARCLAVGSVWRASNTMSISGLSNFGSYISAYKIKSTAKPSPLRHCSTNW